jgi:hypothetical protein
MASSYRFLPTIWVSYENLIAKNNKTMAMSRSVSMHGQRPLTSPVSPLSYHISLLFEFTTKVVFK